jgi:hypothetical protein
VDAIPQLSRPGFLMSDRRSQAGTSLAAKTSLFCHRTDVYFHARYRFRFGSIYTWPVREVSGKRGIPEKSGTICDLKLPLYK